MNRNQIMDFDRKQTTNDYLICTEIKIWYFIETLRMTNDNELLVPVWCNYKSQAHSLLY